MQEKWRKLCTILLIISIIISLAACGGSTTEGKKDGNGPSVSGQQLPQSTDETGSSTEIEKAEQDPEVIPETIEDKAKKAMETLEVWDGGIAESYDAGDGSPENPYQIANATQLAKLAADTNSGVDFSSQYFLLTNDILLNDISAWDFELTPKENAFNNTFVNLWTPIGLNYCFNGSFDGGDHIIYGLQNTGFYSRSGSVNAAGSIGLFGEFRGEISNTTIACGWLAPGAENIGTIAGSADGGYIQNCHVLHVGIEPRAAINVGGVCGKFAYSDMCMISNCSTGGTISYLTHETNVLSVGGIAGTARCYDNDGTIRNCYNAFDVNIYADITVDYSNGYDLPGVNVGGICGNSEIIENCYNAGNITIAAYDKLSDESKDIPFIRAGGITGTCHGSMTNCGSNGVITYTGDIASSDASAGAYIGGIAGLLGNTRAYGDFGELEKVDVGFCYSNTKFDVENSGANIGGISGSACGEITVTNCYYNSSFAEKAINVTLARQHEYYGRHPSSISSKVFTNQIKGLSEVDLKDSKNYYDWDFNAIWIIENKLNNGLPTLRSVATRYEEKR